MDFSRISTNANDAVNGNFINEENVHKEFWEGDLTFVKRDDGSIQILKDGVVMGYTDELGISKIVNDVSVNDNSSSMPNSSSTSNGATSGTSSSTTTNGASSSTGSSTTANGASSSTGSSTTTNGASSTTGLSSTGSATTTNSSTNHGVPTSPDNAHSNSGYTIMNSSVMSFVDLY